MYLGNGFFLGFESVNTRDLGKVLRKIPDGRREKREKVGESVRERVRVGDVHRGKVKGKDKVYIGAV